MWLLFFLPLHVLQCQHGEVIALLGITYEVGNSLSHLFNECVWLRRCSLQHFFNPFLAKHLSLGIFGLVQAIGIEEECGAWYERCLLQRICDIGHGTYGEVTFDSER